MNNLENKILAKLIELKNKPLFQKLQGVPEVIIQHELAEIDTDKMKKVIFQLWKESKIRIGGSSVNNLSEENRNILIKTWSENKNFYFIIIDSVK